MKFLVVDCPSAYNAILGRPLHNVFMAIISNWLLVLKFLDCHNKVIFVRGDQVVGRSYYNMCLRITCDSTSRKKMRGFNIDCQGLDILLAELDPRVDLRKWANFEWPQLEGEMHIVHIGSTLCFITHVRGDLELNELKRLKELIQWNKDLFAQIASNMSIINLDLRSIWDISLWHKRIGELVHRGKEWSRSKCPNYTRLDSLKRFGMLPGLQMSPCLKRITWSRGRV